MANTEQIEILRRGVATWNSWKNETFEETLDQSTDVYLLHEDIDLSEADLQGIHLHGVDLSKANLNYANLQGGNLQGANLSGTFLMKADLSNANLCDANLSRANLREADLSNANLKNADLRGADLTYARLIETNLEMANLTGCRVYGISAWDLKLQGTMQNELIVSPLGKPTIITDYLDLAQIMYLLLLDHKKIRNVINSLTERCVLILGRFGEKGLDVLQAIAAKLREMKYLPIIFDFDKPVDKDCTETVITLAGLSRFVIVDLSGPSVPQELYATVPHFMIPFVPIIQEGRKPYSLHIDILKRPWVLNPIIQFRDKDHIVELIPLKVIQPAEEMFRILNRQSNR
jgi:uncharacterized protein YjbI with pentapeptide repeats